MAINQSGRPRRLADLVVSVLILTAALAASFSSYAIADAAWLHPYQYGDPGELSFPVLRSTRSDRSLTDVPDGLVSVWRETLGAPSVGAYRRGRAAVDLGSGARQAWIVRGTPGLVALTRLQPVVGREIAEHETGAVMLSHSAWVTEFGRSRDVPGRRVLVDGSAMTIVGVAPEAFVLPGVPRPALFLPLRLSAAPAADLDGPTSRALIRSSAPRGALGDRIRAAAADQIAALEQSGAAGRISVALRPIQQAVRPAVAPAPVFLGMIACILVMSLLSVAYLETANFGTLGPKAAIHLALGAPHWRITTLAVWRVCRAMAIALAGAILLSHAVLQSLGPDLQRSLGLVRPPALTAFVLATGAAFVAAVAAVMGALLARNLWRRLRAGTYSLSGGRAIGGVRARARHVIVAGQLACSGTLLTLAAASAALFLQLVKSDMGLDPEHVLVASVLSSGKTPEAVEAEVAQLRVELQRVPGATHVSFAHMVPLDGAFPWREPVAVASAAAERTKIRHVDHEYFGAMRIAVVRGRGLSASDMTSPPGTAVVSESFARQRLTGDPLGQPITVGKRVLHIVGIAADVRDQAINRPAEPTVYVPYSDRTFARYAERGVLIRADADDQATIRASEAAMARVLTGRKVTVTRMTDGMGDVFVTPATYALLTGTFALLALALATFGTYAVTRHLAMQRRKEIAVRTACGATRLHVIRMFAREAAWPIGAGLAAGALIGSALASGIAGVVFNDSPVPGWSLIAAALLLAAGAFSAVLFPARRAASVSPAAVLRSD